MSFAAKYPGRCSVCDERIHVGDEIRNSDGLSGFEHVTCPEDRKPAEVCQTCWLEKPCPCEDGL